MAVYKRYNGKKVTAKDPNYKKGRWYIHKRVKGHKTIHKSVPEAITKDQAETAERQEIEKLFNHRYGGGDTTTTFEKFVDEKYMKYVKQHNTNVYAKELFIKELKKTFGKHILSEITAQDCRNYQSERLSTKTKLGTDRSPSSVNKEMSTLSIIFTLACQERIITKENNPMQFVETLKEPLPRKKLLTEEQREKLWNALAKDDFMRRIVLLAVNLPLRRGQILAITKEAVDLDRRTLVAVPSKGRPARIVPLNATALSVLTELCAETDSGRLFKIPESPHVLKALRGQPVVNFKRRWSSLLVRIGINEKKGKREENFHFHDLRTEFASRLISNNVNAKTVQQLFAHSDTSITDIYTQIVDSSLFDAVNSLDEVKTQEVAGVN